MSSYPGLKNADRIFLLFILSLTCTSLKATAPEGSFNKGSFYFYWGYNRGYFSKSDIRFTGRDYDFTIRKVRSNDRQSKFGVHPYLDIEQMTIPQYNYRLGYCINRHYNLSLGFDHMKYVMNQGQTLHMDGYIQGSGTRFDGKYQDRIMEMSSDFLQFEHTDGLNYIDMEITRTDQVKQLGKHMSLNSMAGFGAGVLCPRTRVVLLDRNVNDQWHVSGYGLSSHIGLNLTVYRHFFLQTSLKGGFINMPDIVTTAKSEDRARQHFFFVQTNVVLGYRFGGKRL